VVVGVLIHWIVWIEPIRWFVV